MSDKNKAILEQANAAIVDGDTEGFLSFCSEDIIWTTVGEATLTGKPAVRAMMAKDYVQAPKFTVEQLIAEGDFLIALGEIIAPGKDGNAVPHRYCDVWRLKDDRLAELQAFVVEARSA